MASKLVKKVQLNSNDFCHKSGRNSANVMVCVGVWESVSCTRPLHSPPSCSVNGAKSKTPENTPGQVAPNTIITDKSAGERESSRMGGTGKQRRKAGIPDTNCGQQGKTELEPGSEVDHTGSNRVRDQLIIRSTALEVLRRGANSAGSESDEIFPGRQIGRQRLRPKGLNYAISPEKFHKTNTYLQPRWRATKF